MAIKYDPDRHCGAPLPKPKTGVTRGPKRCLKLKSHCPEHSGKPANYYSQIRRNRLDQIMQKARDMGADPSDITGELELVRALLIAYVEDHTDLDDAESVSMTGELADRVIRAAQAFRKMRQEEMLHIKAVELLTMRMSDVLMDQIEKIDPNLVAEWKQVLIERIRDAWGQIYVPTSIRELKRISDGGEDEGEDNG